MVSGEAMSIRAIAQALGCSPTTVMKMIHERDADDGTILVSRVRGLDGKVRLSRRLDTSERDEEIVARWRRGDTFREIAEAVGCSVGTAHRIIVGYVGG